VVCSVEYTDVFIVGGGPAGLATAIASRQKGLSVTVADGAAPPIEKPCGEGMMPETLACLKALGVGICATDGYRFRGICFAQGASRVCADFPEGSGIGLRRPLLHERLLARAQECGVKLLWNTPVSNFEGNCIRHVRGETRSKWIVGADGQGSRLRRWCGLDRTTRNKQRQATRRRYRLTPWSPYMEIHWGRHCQAYVTPIASNEVCVVIISEKAEHTVFDRALEELPELRCKLMGAEMASRERGAITLMRTLQHVQRGNVALVGDASGGVDSITGEGLRLAFQQAFALAYAMAAGDLLLYERAHRRIVRRPMVMGELMLWFARSPRIRASALRAMQSKQELFATLVATHVGKGNAVRVLSTGAQLGLRLLRA
jgi:menaquinone-9 beta-reductase